jgi:hypothetical protein
VPSQTRGSIEQEIEAYQSCTATPKLPDCYDLADMIGVMPIRSTGNLWIALAKGIWDPFPSSVLILFPDDIFHNNLPLRMKTIIGISIAPEG